MITISSQGAIVIFVVALILLISMRQPVVIITKEDHSGQWGGLIILLGLILVGLFWMGYHFNVLEPETPKDPTPYVPKEEEYATHDLRSQDPLSDSFFQEETYPGYYTGEKKGKYAVGQIENFVPEEEDYTEEIWCLVLRRYYEQEAAMQLQKHFSQRNIEVLSIEDQYWAVIKVENEKTGLAEYDDWLSHKEDWKHLGLILELTEIKL